MLLLVCTGMCFVEPSTEEHRPLPTRSTSGGSTVKRGQTEEMDNMISLLLDGSPRLHHRQESSGAPYTLEASPNRRAPRRPLGRGLGMWLAHPQSWRPPACDRSGLALGMGPIDAHVSRGHPDYAASLEIPYKTRCSICASYDRSQSAPVTGDLSTPNQ